MRNYIFSALSLVILSSVLFSCKKGKQNPDPKNNGIALFDLTVYDSDLWTPQNNRPIAAGVEVEVFELFHFKNVNAKWEEGDSTALIFRGKTNDNGIVSVTKMDTSLSRNVTYVVKLKKGNRTNYSPDGFLCWGVFENQEEFDRYPRYPKNSTVKIGDKRLVDFNSDGLISDFDKNRPGARVASRTDRVTSYYAPGWLY